ncbi:MAG: hypothetical protein BV459_06350 [Thermoplasmata archaeon M11B2D]|nr:MAG: hypothetical protein BV459_06350 [Thermoplasmata archaeon M11B2D]
MFDIEYGGKILSVEVNNFDFDAATESTDDAGNVVALDVPFTMEVFEDGNRAAHYETDRDFIDAICSYILTALESFIDYEQNTNYEEYASQCQKEN